MFSLHENPTLKHISYLFGGKSLLCFVLPFLYADVIFEVFRVANDVTLNEKKLLM